MINIDYNVLAEDLLPTELRDQFMVEWLQTILSPIITQYGVSSNEYADTIFQLQHSAQLLSLEHFLNEKFLLPNGGFTEIYIEDGKFLTEYHTFLKGADRLSSVNNYGEFNTPFEEGQLYTTKSGDTAPFGGFYTYTKEETEVDQVDFIIKVDSSWITPEYTDMIKEYVDLFRKVGKTYEIETYTN